MRRLNRLLQVISTSYRPTGMAVCLGFFHILTGCPATSRIASSTVKQCGALSTASMCSLPTVERGSISNLERNNSIFIHSHILCLALAVLAGRYHTNTLHYLN